MNVKVIQMYRKGERERCGEIAQVVSIIESLYTCSMQAVLIKTIQGPSTIEDGYTPKQNQKGSCPQMAVLHTRID